MTYSNGVRVEVADGDGRAFAILPLRPRPIETSPRRHRFRRGVAERATLLR